MCVSGRKLFRDKGRLKNHDSLIGNLRPVFPHVDLPRLGGPTQLVFDDVIVIKLSSNKGEAGIYSNGVSPDILQVETVEVGRVRIEDCDGGTKSSGDFSVGEESTV